ncbi:glycosyl transferase family 1 [Azorhizobium oxalatiphilum]|uniref:Glycosyl transferase family 1 n=1 Tax=Azorhizobium oxalatiphilum TaxID=980631 RepID=A0A917CB03_9HYPH|nr:MSMEG_0565 family glycosyltransferase [Azorhizobium oxalatiphilum]GGF80432.1 glycosyl transferase family 1 [Azorhizobium oxalatiphilum]
MSIALLAHSTNPRGGVVHALELGEALTRLGHKVTVHAPDASGRGFFRPASCATLRVPARPVAGDTTALVETRIADYVRHFEDPTHRRFDVFHAQDGISGNALATLKERGLISGFARTVHHMDAFADPRLAELQHRSIAEADELFVVSRAWQARLEETFGRTATPVGNGVDTTRFSPLPDGREGALRTRLGLGAGPVVLAVGGIEQRKNTVRILEAFIQLRALHPNAQLIIAGGASLLDHDAYRQSFQHALRASPLPPGAVIITGPLPQDDMPALYRIADTLAFPSLKEGFGLVVLEAMASGIPVVAPAIAPFTEYLGPDDVAWCDPLTAHSIADALLATLTPAARARFIARGERVALAHGWQATAAAHLPAYARLKEPAYA